MHRPSTGLAAFALACAISTGPALADQNLNCNKYASEAVYQYKANVNGKCGLHGVGWSGNYHEHLTWCKLDTVKMKDVTAAHNFRAAAITQCKALQAKKQNTQLQPGPKMKPVVAPQLDVACGQYATLARKQNQQNHANNCGFSGGAWSDNVNGHRAWCLTASPNARQAQVQMRQGALLKCTTTKVFDNPKGRKVKGRRWPLDECESSLRLFCGTTQAENFCKASGFKSVASFVKSSASSAPAKNRGTPGVVSSYLNSDGYCGGRKCTFYTRITCKGRS